MRTVNISIRNVYIQLRIFMTQEVVPFTTRLKYDVDRNNKTTHQSQVSDLLGHLQQL